MQKIRAMLVLAVILKFSDRNKPPLYEVLAYHYQVSASRFKSSVLQSTITVPNRLLCITSSYNKQFSDLAGWINAREHLDETR